MDNLNTYITMLMAQVITHGPKVLLAILVLIIGLSVIRNFSQLVGKTLANKDVDPTLTPFLLNIVVWGLRILLIISVASMIGVETTSFIAVVGAAGLAIGLALQGSLANFAGGVLILLFKPFVKGHYIEALGHDGTVEKIDIFATIIRTPANNKVVLPNGPLASGTINNYNDNQVRRIQLEVGIGYNDDIRKACEALEKMCADHSNVLTEPDVPFAGVISYGDNSINLIVRCWVATENYWPTFFVLNENIKTTLDQNNISIPYPQRDVHIYNQ